MSKNNRSVRSLLKVLVYVLERQQHVEETRSKPQLVPEKMEKILKNTKKYKKHQTSTSTKVVVFKNKSSSRFFTMKLYLLLDLIDTSELKSVAGLNVWSLQLIHDTPPHTLPPPTPGCRNEKDVAANEVAH